MPPVIHIAGTNGKGSTTAFCRALLEASGLSVHVHSSPHLVRWHERFRIGGPGGTSGYVDDQLLAETLRRVEAANDGAKATVFEMLTAATFVLFAEIPADAVLLEVGLGGRFDATNIIEKPAVSVIIADLAGSSGLSRRSRGAYRRGKGRHHETRCACGNRPAGI